MTRRPELGSPWARHCPDVYPREWMDGGQLPAGFGPATTYEADLITGRTGEGEYLRRIAKPFPSTYRTPKETRKRKPHPVVRKLHGWNRFLDALARRGFTRWPSPCGAGCGSARRTGSPTLASGSWPNCSASAVRLCGRGYES